MSPESRYMKKRKRMADRQKQEEERNEGRKNGGREGGRKDSVVKRQSGTIVSLLYFAAQENRTQKRKFNPASNDRAFPLPGSLIGSEDEIK